MVLKHIRINNLRVFKSIELEFNNDLNIIHGLNGQGKTSLLEAIYYLSLTKSFRVNKDEIVLKNECDYFEIEGKYLKEEESSFSVRVYYSNSEGKHVFINSNKIGQFSELIGINPVILLSLDDLDLTFGFPSARRKFMDILLSQLYPGYLHNLRNYKKSVSQKNKLLNSSDEINNRELETWNKQLVNYGTEIIEYRLNFLKFANTHINNTYQRISGKKEVINIHYVHSLNGVDKNTSNKDLKWIFEDSLKKIMDNEIKRKTSLTGPHKDDLLFLKNEYPLKTYGSQGENKSFLLTLKIIESSFIFQNLNKRPLFLLDDIFGELDNERINNLVQIIKDEGQTFITTTEVKKFKNSAPENTKFFHIKNHAVN